jgi:hypothetical protein
MVPYCCRDFEVHSDGSAEDGFRIRQSLWMLPYVVKLVLLMLEIPGQPARAMPIRFCPWCGRDLEVTAGTFLGPLDK